MVQYKVLKDANDLKTGKEYRKDEVVEEKVKVVDDFEKRLKKKVMNYHSSNVLKINKLIFRTAKCSPFISK